MAAIGRADLRLCGSHAGVSIGEDGPSQMALEDLAALRAIHGTTVLYPADGNATVRLVTSMADLRGISYLRTTREATETLYGPEEAFPIGGSKTLRHGEDVALVAAGITVHESLRAADLLAAKGIAARVIDCYCVKPIDAETLRGAAAETGLLIVVEDHRIEGGLGDAVLDALAGAGPPTARVIKLAVTDMPGSGAPQELRAWAGIDAEAIVGAVTDALGRG
jgi:transketolase